MESQPDLPTPDAPSRRSLLAKGALATGAAWVAPLVTSMPAAAQVGSHPGEFDYVFQFGGAGAFSGPIGVAVDSNNRIIVADTGNHRVRVFSVAGIHQLTIAGPTPGAGLGSLDSPQGVAVDAMDRIYVADTGNHRVQLFDSAGSFVGWFGTPGSGPGQFQSPTGVAVDSLGRVIVVDSGNNRIQVFDPV